MEIRNVEAYRVSRVTSTLIVYAVGVVAVTSCLPWVFKCATTISLVVVRQEAKGLLNKKHIYCRYTETKLISLFNVIPLDFNSPVPEFHKFFLIPSEKRLLIAS
jgi:hypothetical protein